MVKAHLPTRHRPVDALFRVATDEHMPSPLMTAYLQYRLHLIEAEIELLEEELRSQKSWARHARGSSAWNCKRRDEQRVASLTSLRYLLNARDSLRRAMSNSTLRDRSPAAGQ